MGTGHLRVGLLGPFEVEVEGQASGPAGPRRRGLLALLAVEANMVVPVDSLIDGLWGSSPPPSAVNLIHTYVSTWRKALAGSHRAASGDPRVRPIVTVGAGYRLELEGSQCDRLLCRRLTRLGCESEAAGNVSLAAAQFSEALELWRGPALVDLSSEPFHNVVASELEAERCVLTELWARAMLRSGRDTATVTEALAQMRKRDPLRENWTELLMWALTASGQQATALDVFMTTQRLLRSELGADPGPSLAAMHQRVLSGDPTLQVRAVAAADHLASARRPPAVPVPRDLLVGRTRDLVEIRRLLQAQRLITLTGPGGSGKTRLALEALERHSTQGGTGWFVDLAPLRDVHLVPSTIATALDVQASAGTDVLVAVTSTLATTTGVLVLDNLEHLPDAHQVVARVLNGARDLHILVTSREPLRISGEHQYHVPLLDVPGSGPVTDLTLLSKNESIILLKDRALAHNAGFSVDEHNAPALVEIARTVEGLPLALEIVAPWLRVLTPAELAHRLKEASLDLPQRRSDTPARHRTLRETIEWSYRLLEPSARELLCHLGIFVGSFTVEAVENVCPALTSAPRATITTTLLDLVEHNLVQVLPPVGEHARFHLLEAVREFTAGQAPIELGLAASALPERHADWYASWAGQLAAHSEGPESGKWLAAAIADADNLRSAMATYAGKGRADELLQLVVDGMTLWFEAGHENEGETRLASALATAGPASAARPIALTYWAWLRAAHNRPEAAAAAAEAVQLASHFDDTPVEAFALQTLAETLDDAAASETSSRAAFDAALRAEHEDRPVRYGPTAPDAVRCGASYNLAAVWLYRSVPQALSWQLEALHRARLEGDRRIIAVNAARLAVVHLLDGDVAAARGAVDQTGGLISARVTARWEDIVGYAEGLVLQHEGRSAQAERRFRGVYSSAWSGGRRLHTILSGTALADLYTAQGRLNETSSILEEVANKVGALTERAHVVRLSVRAARVARAKGKIDEAAFILDSTGADIATDSLPPERVVWLVETAEMAAARGDHSSVAALMAMLRQATEGTGVHLPPWEFQRVAALEYASAAPMT